MMTIALTALLMGGCGAGMGSPAGDAPAPAPETQADEAAPADQKEAGGQEETEPVEAEPADAEIPAASSADADSTPIVGVITYSGGVEDASFNQSAWEGLNRLTGSTECETRFYESLNEGDFQKHMHTLIDEGGDLCWGIGYSCADALLAEAEEHPDISFAIVDYAYPDTPANMTGVMFRANEPSFLAGYIAGCVTQTGKIGFVGGEHNEVIDQFQYGYQAGADYAAKEKRKAVETSVVYAGSFVDTEKGRALAAELYDGGCDIVFHAAGETGIGVIDAAREAGKYVIGVDKDQSYLAPENVLTSVLKNVNSAVFQVSRSFLNGDLSGGSTISLGLSDDAVGISEEHGLYPDEIYEEMLTLKTKIARGELLPPDSEETYGFFLEGIQ